MLSGFVPEFFQRLGLKEMNEVSVVAVADVVRFTLEQKKSVCRVL